MKTHHAIIIGASIIALAILFVWAFPRYERVPGGWHDRWTGDTCEWFGTREVCVWESGKVSVGDP